MKTIKYTFADGREEKIEVNENLEPDVRHIPEETLNREIAIPYPFADGHTEDVEVTELLKLQMTIFEQKGKSRRNQSEANDISLNYLQTRGRTIKDDTYNPETVFFKKEPPELPLLNILTDYQRQIAVMHYIRHMGVREIAKELKVSQPTISILLKRISKKVVSFFM